MRIGVLGGTFDPPHLGHLILAHCAYEQLHLDRLLWLPAGDPWRKAEREVSPADLRLELVRLAVSADPRFEVDETEIRRQGPTYTVETLQQMRARLGPDTELFFIVGEDALEDLPYWHKPQEILSMATLAVAPRLDTPAPVPPEEVTTEGLDLGKYERIHMPFVGISSTDLRERARSGLSLRYFTTDSVVAFVREKGLYR